jgi:CheY-like chemotaxis protein
MDQADSELNAPAPTPDADSSAGAAQQRIAELEFEIELQRKAQATLEKVHREAMSLYECAPVGYLLLDHSGLVCRANRSAAASFQIAEAEMRGTRFVSFVSMRSQKTFEGQLASVFSNKQPEACDAVLCRRGGEPFWARLRMNLAPPSQTTGEGVFLTVDEIGDLKDPCEEGKGLDLAKQTPKRARGVKKGRLLVVDDEELILNAVTRVLQRIGYEVMGHTDPVAALSGFEADPTGIDAVITDFRMPEMTGLQLSEKLVAAKPGVPILLVSGYTGEIDRARAKQIGIDQVVSKPLSTVDFANWLDHALAGGRGSAKA